MIIQKRNLIYLLLWVLFFGNACKKPTPTNLISSTEKGDRVVVKVDQGPYIGVDSAALARLEAFREQKNPLTGRLHIGRSATVAEIAAWDIDIQADGHGLPGGSGSVAQGKTVYEAVCASCHGVKGEGIKPLYAALVAKESQGKTIGSYWPYATTLFDYIRRAMPYNTPGTLTDEEVYALTAYLLHLNELLPEDARLDAESLPKVVMPNVQAFIPDDRENANSLH